MVTFKRKTQKRKLRPKRRKYLLRKLVNYKFYLSNNKPTENDMEHIALDLDDKYGKIAFEAASADTGRIV